MNCSQKVRPPSEDPRRTSHGPASRARGHAVNEYEGVRRVIYGEGATFIPVCETCGRFVRPDPIVLVNGRGLKDEPNADCSKCGRVKMLFEGFI